jgi:hypothetical protein
MKVTQIIILVMTQRLLLAGDSGQYQHKQHLHIVLLVTCYDGWPCIDMHGCQALTGGLHDKC